MVYKLVNTKKSSDERPSCFAPCDFGFESRVQFVNVIFQYPYSYHSMFTISGTTPGMLKSIFEYKVVPSRGLGTWFDVLADLK